MISGKNLERYYHEKYQKKKRLKQIYQEYQDKSDPDSVALIDRLITFFGKGMAVVINILDPDVIVLGGGVGNIDLL